MQQHRTHGPRDDAPLPEVGDLAFVGLDMRAPSLARPGYVASALNKRILDGVYETRRGLFSPVWGRHASSEWPYRSSYLRDDDAAWLADYATSYGAGVYSDPAGDVWIVRATAGALLFFRETEIGRIVPYAAGLAVEGAVQLVQNFNELIVVRGDDDTSLVWSGNWAEQVEELVPASVAGSHTAMPGAHFALAWRERSIFLSGRDDLIFSRLADSAQYHTTAGIVYVNRGRGDVLRAALPIGAASLLVLKSQSVHVVTYLEADLSDLRQDVQPVDIQFDAPQTLVAADGRAWWLDRRGVRTAEIAAVDADNKILLRVQVVSEKIAPLLRRIAWRYASQFSAVVTTDRIYFAVALDTQTTPQTLLVWNRLYNEWESHDQWDTAALGDFAVLGFAPAVPWLNEPRLFAISPAGQIACLEYGLGEDHVGWSGTTPVRAAIADELITRGYTAGTNDPKQFRRVQVQLDTWAAAVELQAIFDGPGETKDLTEIARDRSRYFTGEAAFALDNADGRFHASHRQDYSVALSGPLPSTTTPTWTAGDSYTLGQQVYRDYDGHYYTALAPTTAELGNIPSLSPLVWQYIRPDDDAGGSAYYDYLRNSAGDVVTNSAGDSIRMSHAPAWTVGASYAAGDSVGYAGSIYTCLRANTAALGNQPEQNPALWQDQGADAELPDCALFLGDGVRLEDFQTRLERRDIGREAAWCQLAIRGTAGAHKVRSVALEAYPGSRSNLVAA